jgi:hypothetical protein
MIGIALVVMSVAGVVAAAMMGRKFIAADDAREDLEWESERSLGWIPTGADELALRRAARELAVSRRAAASKS